MATIWKRLLLAAALALPCASFALDEAFAPRWQSQSISVTTTTASATLTKPLTRVLRLYNAGSATVFVRVTEGASSAVVTDMPIPSGGIETFTKLITQDTVSAIAASGTATLYITQGEGM